MESPLAAAAAGNSELDVWENLRAIFADMDATGGEDSEQVALREPLTHLRRLLALHEETRAREAALADDRHKLSSECRALHNKLRAVEAVVRDAPQASATSAAAAHALWDVLYADDTERFLRASTGSLGADHATTPLPRRDGAAA